MDSIYSNEFVTRIKLRAFATLSLSSTISTAKTGYSSKYFTWLHAHVYTPCIITKNSTEVTYVYEPSVHTDHADESVHNKNIDEDEVHTGPPREFEGPGARYCMEMGPVVISGVATPFLMVD